VFGACGRALEDAAADPRLEDDVETALAGACVIRRPPARDLGRPDVERVGRRAGDLE
jgi:hypothetical protein